MENNKEFKKSEVVEVLRTQYTEDNPIKLYTKEEPRKVGQPDEKLTTKAYNQICDMWNNNEKSRGFIKYLIHNFLPIDNMSKMLSYSKEEVEQGLNRCCILRIKLGNIAEMVDYFAKVGVERLQATAKAYVEGRDQISKESWQKIKEIMRETPVEIKNGTVGYVSKDEKKYLSGEALVALKLFVEDCLIRNEKEVNFLIRKLMLSEGQKSVKKEKRLNDKQLNQVTAKSLYGAKAFMDDETISKLQELKKELEGKKK